MSTRLRARLTTAAQISALRELQQKAAQAKAVDAANALREREAQEAACAESLVMGQSEWTRFVSGVSIDLQTARAWMFELDIRQGDSIAAETATARAGEAYRAAGEHWRLANHLADDAARVGKTARKHVQRAAEEARLADVLERSSLCR